MRTRSSKSLKFFLRLMRHPGTPESVGRGVAAGLFSAFAIPAGQMVLAFLLAVAVRGAKGAAVLSSWITNPLTMPVIYPLQCFIGGFLIGAPLSYSLIKRLISDTIHHQSKGAIWTLGGELIVSFFAGGLLIGTLAAIIGYFGATAMIRRHRARMANRKQSRINHFKIKRGNCEIN